MLIMVCLIGLCGLFLFRDYVKKISALSVCYSSFVILMFLISIQNSSVEITLNLIITILIVFSINLMIGIGLMKNIGERKK